MPDEKAIGKALKELQAAGAEIIPSQKPAQGTKITTSVLNDLEKGMSPSWDAWISWTKAI